MAERCERCGYFSPSIVMEHEDLIRQIAKQGIEYTMDDVEMYKLKEIFDAMDELKNGKMCRCGMYQAINVEKII